MTETVGESSPSPAESESGELVGAETALGTVATMEQPPPSEPAIGGSEPPVGPVQVSPELELALPAGLNRDVVATAAAHYASTPLAILDIAERAAVTGRDPPRYFAGALRDAIANEQLDELQAQLETEAKAADQQEPQKRITGARWVRGSHGSSFVQDPLGTDQPPHDWPYPPPTPAEILEARETGKASKEASPRADSYEPRPAYDPDAVPFDEFTGAPPAFLTEPDADAVEDHAGHAELDRERQQATDRDHAQAKAKD